MTNYSYKTPYDEGYADGEEMAQKRIAELKLENQRLREAGNKVIRAMEKPIEHRLSYLQTAIWCLHEALLEDR